VRALFDTRFVAKLSTEGKLGQPRFIEYRDDWLRLVWVGHGAVSTSLVITPTHYELYDQDGFQLLKTTDCSGSWPFR